jgi:ArsR family transcriptional regulator
MRPKPSMPTGVPAHPAPAYSIDERRCNAYAASMAVALELAPKTKRPVGEPCCEPVVYPDVDRAEAARLATLAKALGDPIRLQLVDVLRKHAGKVCVCELVPLFDIGQPTLSHHLKKLRDAGIVDSERRGLWVYYYVLPGALKELSAWLS